MDAAQTESDPSHPPDGDPGQRRFEVMAALSVAGAVSLVLAGAGQSFVAHQLQDLQAGQAGLLPTIELAAAGSNTVVGAVLLTLALGLVVLGPGEWVEPVGTRVLLALRWVGLGLVVVALVVVEALLRQPGSFEAAVASPFGSDDGSPLSPTTQTVGRITAALPYLVAAALSGVVAWTADRTLHDLPLAGGERPVDDAAGGPPPPPPPPS